MLNRQRAVSEPLFVARGQELARLHAFLYRALKTDQDRRAQEILITPYALLQEWTERIDDAAIRRSLLKRVSAYREIISKWAYD